MPCQCNSACVEHKDCCENYSFICGSCYGRCTSGYDSSFPCQCNDKCLQYKNCCDDLEDVCEGDTVTDADLKAISEELIRLDDNNAGTMVEVNAQGKTSPCSTVDHASARYINKTYQIMTEKSQGEKL